MRELKIIDDRRIEIKDIEKKKMKGMGEVKVRIKEVEIKNIDVWGWRGMEFEKRKMKIVIGEED